MRTVQHRWRSMRCASASGTNAALSRWSLQQDRQGEEAETEQHSTWRRGQPALEERGLGDDTPFGPTHAHASTPWRSMRSICTRTMHTIAHTPTMATGACDEARDEAQVTQEHVRVHTLPRVRCTRSTQSPMRMATHPAHRSVRRSSCWVSWRRWTAASRWTRRCGTWWVVWGGLVDRDMGCTPQAHGMAGNWVAAELGTRCSGDMVVGGEVGVGHGVRVRSRLPIPCPCLRYATHRATWRAASTTPPLNLLMLASRHHTCLPYSSMLWHFYSQDDVAGCFDYYAGLAEKLDGRQNSALDVGSEDFQVKVGGGWGGLAGG